MDIKGKQEFKLTREQVFEALNDPEVLRQSIPGCKSLEKKSDTEFIATIELKIGPIKAKFEGEVRLDDIVPPTSYRIVGSGKGGTAGNASGSAVVKLEEIDEETTLLTYDVKVGVTGKIAQLGGRLIESTSAKLAIVFFTKFAEVVGGDKPVEDTQDKAEEVSKEKMVPIPIWMWVTGSIIVIAVLIPIIISNSN